jgi:two-component system chemotaxis response regulator CheY
MKALVVEKSNTMRSVLRRILSSRGFEVTEAENGEQAMEDLRSTGRVDLVLANWVPHKIEDLDFVTQLRHETAQDTTVIMLAASEPGMRELQRALMAGADDYLMTPFTSMQLDEKLAQAKLICQSNEYRDTRGLSCCR